MSIVGHDKILEDLKKLAAAGKLSHGYIFFGPAMIGKKMAALSFAHFLERSDVLGGKLLQDGMLIAPDEGNTISIDSVRLLKRFLSQKPLLSGYRTAMIDDADRMTGEAQNAFLKIAEEPPASTLLILVTSDIESLLPTLTSRLQKVYFSPISDENMETLLVDRVADQKKRKLLAEKSFGKPGLALSLAGKDGKLHDLMKSASDLLCLPENKRRDFIKKLIEPDEFNFLEFLDALILSVASSAKENAQKMAFWHKLMRLRERCASFPLNPRLQLEGLLSGL